MIHGTFGVENALLFEIELIVSDDSELEIESIFDTEFSGWIAISDYIKLRIFFLRCL